MRKRAQAARARSARAGALSKIRGSLALASLPPRGGPVEKKVSDITITTYQVNTTGSFTLLHVPVLGTDYTQRIGRKTIAKSVYIRGFVETEEAGSTNTAATATAQQARMIIFVDNQPNAAVPVVADLLNMVDTTSHLNLNNRDRFKIITDKIYVFDPSVYINTATQAVINLSNSIKNIKLYKSLNLETVFNATNGGTIADLTSGALYMFWIGSHAAGSNTDANAVVSTRVRFIDA